MKCPSSATARHRAASPGLGAGQDLGHLVNIGDIEGFGQRGKLQQIESIALVGVAVERERLPISVWRYRRGK